MLSGVLPTIFYSKYNESQKMGSLVVSMRGCLDLFKVVTSTKQQNAIIEYVGNVIDNALADSKNKNPLLNENPTIVTFINLKGVLMSDLTKQVKQFTVKIIQFAQEQYIDIMVKTYIYNPPVFFKIAYSFFYPFIDKDTRQKISVVKKKKDKEKLIMSVEDYCKE